MQRRWVGKNVNLAALTSRIGDFFKAKDFEAMKGETCSGYQILAVGSPYFKLEGHVSVSIEGQPEDFVVEFDLCSEGRKREYMINSITRMFIGGLSSLRRMKSDEAWARLERELLKHIENSVLCLAGSHSS